MKADIYAGTGAVGSIRPPARSFSHNEPGIGHSKSLMFS